jgi:hypothetical protein
MFVWFLFESIYIFAQLFTTTFDDITVDDIKNSDVS